MTESERSDAQVPTETARTSPSEHRSPNGFFRLGSVCFLRAGGLGMYSTSPGLVRDGSFSPLGVKQAREANIKHPWRCFSSSGSGDKNELAMSKGDPKALSRVYLHRLQGSERAGRNGRNAITGDKDWGKKK